MSTPEFTPVMPHALALPWPGWEGVTVVYDLYQCEAFQDERGTLLAASRATRAALMVRAEAVDALPDTDATKTPTLDAWTLEYNAWMRADALQQLAFYGIRVEWPSGQTSPAGKAETWKRFPTRFLLWLTTDGYRAARAALWSTPDPKDPPGSVSVTPSALPSPPDGSIPA